MKENMRMTRRLPIVVLVIALAAVAVVPAFAGGPPPGAGKDGEGRVRVVVYVTSQGKFYDSIVGPSLPPNGPFQLLEMGPMGLQTEFGPGDPGYVGGRWWIDATEDGEMNEGDVFFSCPLLGPGRDTP
jgi:hypothetical protein